MRQLIGPVFTGTIWIVWLMFILSGCDPSTLNGLRSDGIDSDSSGNNVPDSILDPACADADHDGYLAVECDGTDCDDNDYSVNPGSKEICGDGVDNDCNGTEVETCPAENFSYPLMVYETYSAGDSALARTNEPISFGFPFPKGQISSLETLSIDGASEMQFTELARWGDGSLKWVLLDYIVPSLDANVKDDTSFALTDGGSGSQGGADICSLSGGVLTVNTGAMNAEIGATAFAVIDELTLADGTQMILPGGESELRWEDAGGVMHSSASGDANRLEVVFNGPVHCHAVAEGMFGDTGMGYRVIYDFYKGKAHVDMAVSLRNASIQSNTHKLVQSAQVRLDTTLEGAGLTAKAADQSSNALSFSLGAGEEAIVSSWRSAWPVLGADEFPTTHEGYAVERRDAGDETLIDDIIPRTAAQEVPKFQWLRIEQGSQHVQVTQRFAPYYYPNGYRAEVDTGILTGEIFAADYPSHSLVRYRMYETRNFRFDFAPELGPKNSVKAFTQQVISVPADTQHFGSAGAFSPFGFSTGTQQQFEDFYDSTNVNITRDFCPDFDSIGTPGSLSGVGPAMVHVRGISNRQPGGGISNNVYPNETAATFLAHARTEYPRRRALAHYRLDWDVYYLDDFTVTDPADSTQMNASRIGASNANEIFTAMGNSFETKGSNAEHQWAYMNLYNFYHFTGREEYRRGLDAFWSWVRTNAFVGALTWVRAYGQQWQGYAYMLDYLAETGDPRLDEHLAWIHEEMDTLLYASTTPSYGDLRNAGFPAGYCDYAWLVDDPTTCESLYSHGIGWLAPPGEAYNPSTASAEVQGNDFNVNNVWLAPNTGGNNGVCPDTIKGFMLTNRFGLALFHLYGALENIDPSDPLLEPLGLRIYDVAQALAGNKVGRGVYQHDFENPDNGVFTTTYCVANTPYVVKSDNNYLISYFYTFAARYAPTQAEKEWWQNMAANSIISHDREGWDTWNYYPVRCAREMDPRTRYTIQSLSESGVNYTPTNYPIDTPFPSSN